MRRPQSEAALARVVAEATRVVLVLANVSAIHAIKHARSLQVPAPVVIDCVGEAGTAPGLQTKTETTTSGLANVGTQMHACRQNDQAALHCIAL